MSDVDMAQTEDRVSLSSVLPWGGKYPPGIGLTQRCGLDVIGLDGRFYRDAHQRILSFSVGKHSYDIDDALGDGYDRYPGMTLVDTTEYFEPATLLMKDLHEAFNPYGDYLIHLATTGTGANEQAIRLAMGSLGGPGNVELLVLAGNYGGASLCMNSVCEAAGWRGDTSLVSDAEVLNLDGSNMDEVFARVAAAGKKPILIMEDGVQGVGGFNVLDEKFLRALAERVHDAGGRKIYDDVQTFVRAAGGKGLFGFNRWADPNDARHLPDFVTLATGLGDGYAQAAVAVKRSVAEEIKKTPGGAGNTFDTFNRQRDALIAARKVLEVTREYALVANVDKQGRKFGKNLGGMVERFNGVVKRVVGLGGMTGLEFQSSDLLNKGMIASPRVGMLVAKGGSPTYPVMRLPLQFDADKNFVNELSACVEDMLKRVQGSTGA